jgi:hypothetical protein
MIILIIVPTCWFSETDMTYQCIPAIYFKMLGLTSHGSHIFLVCYLEWNEDVCCELRSKCDVSSAWSLMGTNMDTFPAHTNVSDYFFHIKHTVSSDSLGCC